MLVVETVAHYNPFSLIQPFTQRINNMLHYHVLG